MLAESVPIANDELIAYKREEKKGFITLMLNDFPGGTKLINSTTDEILSLCNGSNSLTAIQEELSQKYPTVKTKEIVKDLSQTLVLLNRNNLITWKNGIDPFEVEEELFEIRHGGNIRSFRATEAHFDQISEILKRGGITNRSKEEGILHVCGSPAIGPGTYEDILLRSRIFNYIERFYFVEIKSEIIGMLGVLDDYPLSKRAIVSILLLKDNRQKKEILNHLFGILSKDAKGYFEKIKCSVLSTSDHAESHIEHLKEFGFVVEGQFENEFKQGEKEIVMGLLVK